MDERKAMNDREFRFPWLSTIAAYATYVIQTLLPTSAAARLAFVLLALVAGVYAWLWLIESGLLIGERLSITRTETIRARAVSNDPDAVLAAEIGRMNHEQLQVFGMLVEVTEDERKPLDGYENLTSQFVRRFFAAAMDSYPDLPSIRRARGDWMPREQAAELTCWLVEQHYARAAHGNNPARWMSVEAKLTAMRAFLDV